MNHTEYTSLTAMITAIKAQINSLEIILASVANQKTEKTRKENVRADNTAIDPDDYLLSDEHEKQLEAYMERARQEEIEKMSQAANDHYKKLAEEVINETE